MWNHLTFPTWPPWVLLKFCQVNVSVKKWKSWKCYHFILCVSEIITTYGSFIAWIPKPLKILSFWNCFYSAIFNMKHLKFGLVIHFYNIIPKKIYLTKNTIKYVCFSFYFQRAVSWQSKTKCARTYHKLYHKLFRLKPVSYTS